MKRSLVWLLVPLTVITGLGIVVAGEQPAMRQFSPDAGLVDRGRYIALIAGCNDCHTPGYAMSDGEVPEPLWLTGDNFGWRGPWGTTYGTNLRLLVEGMSEKQWIELARTLRRKPPMPWFNLNAMGEGDLRALYHFMRSLGDPGSPAPAALPPGEEPETSYAMWTEKSRRSEPRGVHDATN